MDVSALRDQIKKLQDENGCLSDTVKRFRALGNHDPSNERILSHSKNPTYARTKKRPRSDTNLVSDGACPEMVEKLKETQEQLFREKKAKEKVVQVVKYGH